MRLTSEEIARLRAANPLDYLISTRIKLGSDRGGIRRGACLCTPKLGSEPLWVQNGTHYGCFRSGGQCGGDVFAYLLQHEGLEFAEAVKSLGGRVPYRAATVLPWNRGSTRQSTTIATEHATASKEVARVRAWAIWSAGRPAQGSPVAAYLGFRGIDLPPGCRVLRYAEALPYWSQGQDGPVLVWTGPAMLAAIQGPDGRFIGIHRTWIDPGFVAGMLPSRGNGKALIPGDLGAKKMLGTLMGGAIRLTSPPADPAPQADPALVLLVGEGIETVASVLQAMRETTSSEMVVYGWVAGSLGNLAGGAARDQHGVLMQEVPAMDRPGIALPNWAQNVVLLGDGDSDVAVTQACLARAVARGKAEGRQIETCMAPPSLDFNDVLMGFAGEGR